MKIGGVGMFGDKLSREVLWELNSEGLVIISLGRLGIRGVGRFGNKF